MKKKFFNNISINASHFMVCTVSVIKQFLIFNNKSIIVGGILCLLAMTGISVIITPLFSSQSFPSDAEYPFDVQPLLLKIMIYLHHILITYQSVIQVSTNTFPALLLWFVAARFNILSIRFRRMTNMKELIQYTHEHNLLLRYIVQI